MGAGASTGGADPPAGNLLVFGAVVGEAAYVVCGKILSRRLSPLAMATGMSTLGLVMCLPWEARRFDLRRLEGGDWIAIGSYGIAAGERGAALLARPRRALPLVASGPWRVRDRGHRPGGPAGLTR
ncbi:MAG: hypothetical protein AUH81_11120 [Candidatus Rokubacteria bacterium 13_1_40CM_4_69_5]|nr:MAG: hypothetical protein AUH81_11120 [Candidatus Rokubacteria bacterium 13_1_40CM_4_69_5]